MSFESEKPFNDFQHFARGIRRSGNFTIRESEILEKCGSAMMDLYNGVREPADEIKSKFVEQLKSRMSSPIQKLRFSRNILTSSSLVIYTDYALLAMMKSSPLQAFQAPAMKTALINA